METRHIKSLNEEISLLGFGGMRFPRVSEEKQDIDEEKASELIDYAYRHGVNYFDTAYPYHAGLSEPFFGRVMQKYPRESFRLASKMPLWLLEKEGDQERIFEEQLKRCNVEYFDFYLMHNINTEHKIPAEKFRTYEFLMKQKEQGLIRHLGFSFHDTVDLLSETVNRYQFDFGQLQINYLDWELQNAKREYEILTEHNLPIVVMEPVRGGALAALSEKAVSILKEAAPKSSPASWAIRYVASLPNVMTILSGMSNLSQVKDNVATLSAFKPLTNSEREVLQDALTAYKSSGAIPCTGCRYCMDCPAGVDIPKVFAAYNQYCGNHDGFGFQGTYKIIGEEHQADKCIACGQCLPLCPQRIAIPDRMAEIREFNDTLVVE